MKILLNIVLALLYLFVSPNGKIGSKQSIENNLRIDTLINYLYQPNDQHILVAAHRADWRNYPENSMEGVISCLNMGVDIIEIDVHKTKDGELVLMHDKTLDRTSNGSGNIEDFTLAEIKKLNLKNAYGVVTRYKVPVLEDVLLAVKGKAFLFIDKAYKILPDTYKLVEKTGTQKEALFEGKATLAELKADYPDYAGKIKYMPRLNGDKKNIQTLNYINDYANAKELVATFILSYETEKSPGIYYAAEIRKRQISVMANALWSETSAGHDDDFSVENPAKGWGWLISHGANIICTDRPQLLLNYLHSNKLHN